jgi:hypothetical protein
VSDAAGSRSPNRHQSIVSRHANSAGRGLGLFTPSEDHVHPGLASGQQVVHNLHHVILLLGDLVALDDFVRHFQPLENHERRLDDADAHGLERKFALHRSFAGKRERVDVERAFGVRAVRGRHLIDKHLELKVERSTVRARRSRAVVCIDRLRG